MADYVVGGEGGKMRALVEACSGIQVRHHSTKKGALSDSILSVGEGCNTAQQQSGDCCLSGVRASSS